MQGTGIIGSSAKFDGTLSDFISAPAGAFDFGDSPFTWSLWFYVDTMQSSKMSLVESRGDTSNKYIGVVLDGSTQKLGMFTYLSANGSPTEVFGSSTVDATTWYHVVMKRDETGNYSLYLNNQLEAEDLQSTGTLSRASDLTGYDSAINPPTYSVVLIGRIDEVACYFRDLPPHHIDMLYGQGQGNQSMLEYKWHDQPAHSDVHMNSHKVTNLKDPTTPQDAVTRNYLEGGIMANALDMNSKEVQNVVDPSSAQDAVTRNYLESGSMANALDMNSQKITNVGAPANAQDVTSKRYVDSLAGTPPLKDQLRAYYAFDGDYKDSTTNNYDGTPNSTTLASGKINQALDCNGSWVDIPGVFNWGSGDFSLGVWVYRNNSSTKYMITHNYDNNNFITLEYNSNQNFRIFTRDKTSDVGLVTNNSYPPGNWYYVVVTRTGGTGEIWVNGQLDVSGGTQPGNLSGTPSNSVIGKGSVLGSNNPSLDGLIDEVGVWFRVLSQGEIQHLYNNGNGTQYLSTYDWYSIKQSNHINMDSYRISNVGRPLYDQDATSKRYVDSLAGTPPLKDQLRAYYSLDGDYKDSTTNNYDGQQVGSGSLNFSGTSIAGQSIEFSGTDGDYVDLGASTFDFSGDFTWQCWVNIKSDQSQCSFLVSGATTDSGSNRIFMGQSDSGDNYQIRFVITGSSYDKYLTGIVPSTGQWYHLILVREGTNYRMYVNGTKQVDITSSQTGLTGGVSQIGRDDQFNPDAYIDEVGAWDRVLTEQEILHLYNHGNGTQYLSTYDWYAVTQNNHVDMNGYRVSNLGEALQSGDAVDKAYVDSRAPMAQLEQGARAYYKFDGDYTDSIGSYDGTNNGTSFTSKGIINQAFEIEQGEYVDLGNAFNFGTGDFSLSLWLYLTTSPSTSQHILRLSTGGAPPITEISFNTNNNQKLRLRTRNGTTEDIFSQSTLSLNTWYFITVTRQGGTGVIYINGQQDNSGTLLSIDVTGNDCSISDNRGGSGDGIQNNGRVDEVGGWDRVLTENEIKYLYHEGQGTNDFLSYDYTFNYDIDMNQHQILNTAGSQTTAYGINNGSVVSYSPPNDYGMMVMKSGNSVFLFQYDLSNGNLNSISQLGSQFNDATSNGSLSGTTGTDGKINISADNANNQIDIENRRGSLQYVRILNIF